MPSFIHAIKIVSKKTVTPPANSSHPRRCHLTAWDVPMLSSHYIQKGLLFTDVPSSLPISVVVSGLRSSLSLALGQFYPLAGRLYTERDGAALNVYIECNDEGAEFIHAVAGNISGTDILLPGEDTPSFITSFFPHNGDINHDGYSVPLLSVQLTELAGGAFFLACSFNHVVGDGTSYWSFFNSWAEISRTNSPSPSLPPVHERWFLEEESPPIKLPFSDPSQFVERFAPPPLRERFFHFSTATVAKLKARANKEAGTTTISSFQALSAFMWRAITRARGYPAEQPTSCRIAIQNRARLRPAQPPEYFGNSIYAISTTVSAGELLVKGMGWAARELNMAVAGHTDAAIRGRLKAYHSAPMVYKLTMFDPVSVMVGSSPRFDMYGCDFGWGKASAVRCGPANKFDGKMSAFPGREGGGAVDLEVCLLPHYMEALLGDQEFKDVISFS